LPDINGIAHIQLSVSDMTRSREFYDAVLGAMGMVPVMDDENYFYCVGGRTALAIAPIAKEFSRDSFDQGRVGLHHVCFRARSTEDVDELFTIARDAGANILRQPREDNYAPGYYSTLFEDPDGIRIEVNFVPGRGLLKD
jgi:catechol 2,3-dioxygenase-like lactoylglutathione lyase family enzyme